MPFRPPTRAQIPLALPTKIDPPSWIRGVNVSGLSTYAQTQFPPKYYPEDASSNTFPNKAADANYLAAKNVNAVRLLFSQELLQRTAFGEFDATAWGHLKANVDLFTAKGMHVSLAIHAGFDPGFGAYYNSKFTIGGATPGSIVAEFWRMLAERFASYTNISFSLHNEPQGSTKNVFHFQQLCIDAIRKHHGGPIMVNGNGFSGSVSWAMNYYDTDTPKVSNATQALTLTDPLDNLIFCVHCYADSANGGGSIVVPSGTVLKDEAQTYYSWLVTNNKKGLIEEWGVKAGETNATAAATDFTAWMKSKAPINGGNLIGFMWWTYGVPAAWAGYQYTLAPTSMSYATDSAQMDLLESINAFVDPTAAPVFNPLTSVSGIYARYRPEDYNAGTGIWSNSGGDTTDTTRDLEALTPAFTGGVHVTPDYTATDATANNLPTIGCTSTTGGRKTGFRNRGNVNFTTPITGACTVYSILIVTKGGSLYWRRDRTLAANAGTMYMFSFNGLQAGRDGTNTITTASGAVTTSTAHVVCTVYNGASSVIYVNSLTATVSGNVGTTTISSLGMGNTPGDAAWLWRMGEMYVYTGAHNSTERADMMAYLATKYNKTLV